MNPQLTDNGCLDDDCNFYDVAEECISDEGDHDNAEVPQIGSGGHVTEHSESQSLPCSPEEEEDELVAVTEHSVDLHGSSSHILSSPAPNFQYSSREIESSEALRPPNSEAEEKKSPEKVISSENDDAPAIGSSHSRNPKRFLPATKTLLCVVVSTFALIVVGKLLSHRSEMHGFNMQKQRRAAMRK